MSNVAHPQTLSEYQQYLTDNPKCIVNFCATWCSACDEAEPIFNQLSLDYKDIKFIYLDVQNKEYSSILKDMQITAFPTFLSYVNGKVTKVQKGISKYTLTSQVMKLNQA